MSVTFHLDKFATVSDTLAVTTCPQRARYHGRNFNMFIKAVDIGKLDSIHQAACLQTYSVAYPLRMSDSCQSLWLQCISCHSIPPMLSMIINCLMIWLLCSIHGSWLNNTPRYLSDRISTYAPPHTLRSGTQSLAAVPRINLERYGRRAFSCAGPSLCNALPLGLRTQQDPDHFRRDLKTHLFMFFSK